MQGLSTPRIGRKPLHFLLQYVLDWIVIVLVAVLGIVFTVLPNQRRPFSLADPRISYPRVKETITTTIDVLLALVAPSIIIAILCRLLPSRKPHWARDAGATMWRTKAHECVTGWTGLALSLATAFMVTSGMKIVFGQPRPDLIARCDPDLANIDKYTVGGLGAKVLQGQNLVDWHICRQTDAGLLADAFMSFPSGHASFSFSGMAYLSLYLYARLAKVFPSSLPTFRPQPTRLGNLTRRGTNGDGDAMQHTRASSVSQKQRQQQDSGPGNPGPGPNPLYRRPPIYLFPIILIPLGVATYVVATRYTDYRHHAFDLIFGTLIGLLAAWSSFRWYHLPLWNRTNFPQHPSWRKSRGWGPRNIHEAHGPDERERGDAYVDNQADMDVEAAGSGIEEVAGWPQSGEVDEVDGTSDGVVNAH